MCGRFSNNITAEKLEKYLKRVRFEGIEFQADYNIGPGRGCWIITDTDSLIRKMNWGIFPYGKTEGKLLINARSETVFEKITFKTSILNRRCLIIADSFYEWKSLGKEKIPYRICLKDNDVMFFAGIYNEWISDGDLKSGFVILTASPNREMEKIHKRAPVILTDEALQMEWISNISYSKIREIMVPLSDNRLEIYKVSKDVNKMMNNGEYLHRKIPEQPTLF